jgi:hypothetical protein
VIEVKPVLCQFFGHKSHTDWPGIEHCPKPLETGDKPRKSEHRIEFFSRFHPSLQANNFKADQRLVLLPVGVPEKGRK